MSRKSSGLTYHKYPMGSGLNMNDLAVAICKIEGGRKQMSIAQVKEVLRVINTCTAKEFYPWIKDSWTR